MTTSAVNNMIKALGEDFSSVPDAFPLLDTWEM